MRVPHHSNSFVGSQHRWAIFKDKQNFMRTDKRKTKKNAWKKITVTLPATTPLTPDFIDCLDTFFSTIDAHHLRDHLMTFLLGWLYHEHDSLPFDFKEFVGEFEMLMDVLKAAERPGF